MRQAAIFAWEKKLIKQDALNTHAHSGFQEKQDRIEESSCSLTDDTPTLLQDTPTSQRSTAFMTFA